MTAFSNREQWPLATSFTLRFIRVSMKENLLTRPRLKSAPMVAPREQLKFNITGRTISVPFITTSVISLKTAFRPPKTRAGLTNTLTEVKNR